MVPDDLPELPADVADPRTRLARWLASAIGGEPGSDDVEDNRNRAGHEHREDEVGCRNPEFFEVPRERPSFRVFAELR